MTYRFHRSLAPLPASERSLKLVLMLGLGLLATLAGAAADAQDALTLVRDGKPSAVIVMSEPVAGAEDGKAQWLLTTRSAGYLSHYLKRMSGAELRTVLERDLGEVRIEDGRLVSDAVPAEAYILVGAGALSQRLGLDTTNLGPGGMLLKTTGNVLGLLGPPDSTGSTGGTRYAVVEFLKMQGCRCLWPGELGLIIPDRPTIKVPPTDKRFDPPLVQRKIRVMGPNSREQRGARLLGITDIDWDQRFAEMTSAGDDENAHGMGWAGWHCLGGDAGIRGGHAFGKLWDEHGRDHPGWFALQPDGSREQKSSNRARLCVSNSELIDHITRHIIEQVNAAPQTRSVSIGPNDGGHDWFCTCKVNALGEPGCLTLDPPDSPKFRKARDYAGVDHSLTDRFVWFWNRIAEKVTAVHPDLMFTVDAYSAYQMPPVERELHPNLIVRFVGRFEDWDAWADKASQIYWRPNILNAGSDLATLGHYRYWAENFKYAAHHGAIAVDIDSIMHNWSTRGMDYHVLAQLAWDPSQEIDDIVRDYCDHGFGPASEPIQRYFDQAATLTWGYVKYNRDHFQGPEAETVYIKSYFDALLAVYTEKVIADLRACLDEADAVAPDETVRRRIAFLRVGLDFTDAQVRAYRMLQAFNRDGQLADPAAASRLMKERQRVMRIIFEESPLAVNVAYMHNMSAGRWNAFGRALKQWEAQQPQTTP